MGDAAYYQEHKDDEGEWVAVPGPRRRPERRRLASIVSVRFSPAEVTELRRRAAMAGLSMSGYLRWLALQPQTITTAGTVTVAGPVYVIPAPDEPETDDG